MKHAWRWSVIILSGLACAGQRANYFNDPFLQVTSGIANCPVPEGPMIDEAQMKAEAHSRTERGTSCFLSGRCRLPNSYLYHHEIIPRVKKAILADGRFSDTSVWAEGRIGRVDHHVLFAGVAELARDVGVARKSEKARGVFRPTSLFGTSPNMHAQAFPDPDRVVPGNFHFTSLE